MSEAGERACCRTQKTARLWAERRLHCHSELQPTSENASTRDLDLYEPYPSPPPRVTRICTPQKQSIGDVEHWRCYRRHLQVHESSWTITHGHGSSTCFVDERSAKHSGGHKASTPPCTEPQARIVQEQRSVVPKPPFLNRSLNICQHHRLGQP